MIKGATDLRNAYRAEEVARNYIEERFRQPLGALLHARQVSAVRKIMAARRPARVLEIAPGPARLTCDVQTAFRGRGVLVDASTQMLHEAGRRLGEASRWRCIQGDAFALPFVAVFDMVYSFRLIRHFEAPDRAALFRQVTACLRSGGVFVFDAVNADVSKPLRTHAQPGEYEHFDALLRPEEIRRELEAAGLELSSLSGVQHRYAVLRSLQILVAPRSTALARALIEVTDRLPGGAPLEWIVVCRKP
jgi:ubiquinone/menaquinone biosynthesis C-methylase UbiE